jgi:hypothetical protein
MADVFFALVGALAGWSLGGFVGRIHLLPPRGRLARTSGQGHAPRAGGASAAEAPAGTPGGREPSRLAVLLAGSLHMVAS